MAFRAVFQAGFWCQYGKGTFSISYNGISSSAENLAYNRGTSMVSGIDQWYSDVSINGGNAI